MPEEVKDEGSKGEEGRSVPPVPDVSAGSEDAGSAQPGTDVSALVDTLTAKIDDLANSLPDLIDARYKSARDTEAHRLGKELDELKVLVEKSGGDFSLVKGDLEQSEVLTRIESIEARIGSGEVGGATSAADRQAKSLEDETAEFLLEIQKEEGITISDDELTELVNSRRWSTDPSKLNKEWFGELTKLSVKKVKQGSVSSAAGVGPGGKSPAAAGKMSEDDLVSEIAELQRHPMQNVERRTELIAEAKERGIF